MASLPALLSRIGRTGADDRARRYAPDLVHAVEAHGAGWFWTTDRGGRIAYLTPRIAALLGGGAADAAISDLMVVGEGRGDSCRTLAFHFASRTGFTDYPVRAVAGGGGRWWSMSGRPSFDAIGNFRGFVGWARDLDAAVHAEAEMQRLALFDALTGLANRQRMTASLAQALATTAATNQPTALMLIDLDRFKAVNDTLGHPAGDELLRQVAQRLLRAVGDAGLVGRLGGDEFQLIVTGEERRGELAALADAVIAAVSHPYCLGGRSATIGCSVGIAVAPVDAADGASLVRCADLALYAAKGAGRGTHRFYRGEMLAGVQSRRALEDELRAALAAGELTVRHAPVVDGRTGRIAGHAAEPHWQHPVHGAVPPPTVLAVAQAAGLTAAVGAWLLRAACDDAAGLPEGRDLIVDVPPALCADAALPALVARAIAATGVAADRIVLGVDANAPPAVLAALGALGVRLAQDAAAGLGPLVGGRLDTLRLDARLVGGVVADDPRSVAVVAALCTMAAATGARVLAHGIATQDVADRLGQLGCALLAGPVFGPPRPRAALDVRPFACAGVTGPRVLREARPSVLRHAVLTIAGDARPATVRNLSAGGAMLDVDDLPALAIGAPVLLAVGAAPALPATVRWVEGRRLGVRFDTRLPASPAAGPAARRRPG